MAPQKLGLRYAGEDLGEAVSVLEFQQPLAPLAHTCRRGTGTIDLGVSRTLEQQSDRQKSVNWPKSEKNFVSICCTSFGKTAPDLELKEIITKATRAKHAGNEDS